MRSPHAPSFPYRCDPVLENGQLVDVSIIWPDKTWRMQGRAGNARELALAETLARDADALPVLLGAGLGHGLEALLNQTDGPVAVVDKEIPLQEATGVRERFADNGRVFWVDTPNPETALSALTRWQMAHGHKPLHPVANPMYLRLDPGYYRPLLESLEASKSFDFWAQARYQKFAAWPPRILLVTSKYFLMGEVAAACRRLDVPHHLLHIDEDKTGKTEFVEQLLAAVLEFKPDFIFTLNHLGVDREGVLIDLIERLEIPLASWFVDNPHLILYFYERMASNFTAIFTWDADNLDTLRAQGFPHVHYLPLGVDARRFTPPVRGAASPLAHIPHMDVGFVGNSMIYKVGHRMQAGRFPRELLVRYRDIASGFGESEEHSVRVFLLDNHPDLIPHFEALDTAERRLAFEAMVTWEATRRYRKSCLAQTLPFGPLIAGDKGWKTTFKHTSRQWTWHPEMNYYTELPHFYPRFKINFNCTSKQMKGAVNQRVFDVPATDSFLLTDWRVQIENLFEPGKEVVCFHDPEEIPELIRRYLEHGKERENVARAARKRILAEHTYEHRLQTLMQTMRSLFA